MSTESQGGEMSSDGHQDRNIENNNNVWSARGDGLWKLIEAEPHNVSVDPSLKSVLIMMGYDSMKKFCNFDDGDCKAIETFMKEKLHVILKKKAARSDNPEEVELSYLQEYYGNFFAFMPEDYEILPGHRATLGEISAAAKKLTKVDDKQKRFRSRSPLNRPGCSRLKKSSDAEDEDLTNQESSVVANIKSWLGKYRSKLVDEDADECGDSSSLPVPIVTVTRDGLGNMVGSIQCTISSCQYKKPIPRANNRWVTSNFYRHIEMDHILKETAKKNQPSIKALFASKSSASKKSASDTEIIDIENVNTAGNTFQSKSVSQTSELEIPENLNGADSDKTKKKSSNDPNVNMNSSAEDFQ